MRIPFRNALLAAALALCIAPASAQRGAAFGATADSIEAETFGGCLTTNPSCYHNWIPHEDRENRVLLYTRTAGPRHQNINPRLPAGLNPPLGAGPNDNIAQKAIIRMLNAVGVQVDYTEEVTRLANNGERYRAIIFLNNSRDALWKHGTAVDPAQAVNTSTSAYLDQAKVNLRQYIRAGGGFVAIHNAFGTEYNWPYYEGLLGNANYYNHGDNQDGDVVVVAQDPSTAGLPPRWPFRDEWYNLRPFPTKVKFLLTVDAQKQGFELSGDHPGHGKFHPVAWCQYYDGGRVWVTTLGHDPQFAQGAGFPGGAEFKKLIVQGILSAMGNTDFCTEDHRQR